MTPTTDGMDFDDLDGVISTLEQTPSFGEVADPEPTPTPAPSPSPVVEEPSATPGVSVTPTPAAPTPPVTASEPEPAPSVPATESQPPVSPLTPPAAPTPPVSEPPAPTREEVYAQIQARRAQLQEHLERVYSIPKEDQEALAVEPEKVLPKLAARLYLDVYDSVFQAVAGQLPQLVEQYDVVRHERAAAQDAFYARWPQLKEVPEAKIADFVRAYRTSNPRATREQVIEYVGAAVSIAHGIAPSATPSPASPPARPPMPAGPGAVAPSSVPVSVGQKSVWDEIIEE